MRAPSGAASMLASGEILQLWVLGVLLTLKVSGNDTGGAFAFHEDIVGPKRGPPPHCQTREDEYWYMVEGELTRIVGGKECNATAGSFPHLQRNVFHNFSKKTEKNARMVIMYTPGEFQEWFTKVGKPAHGASLESPAPAVTKEDIRLALHYGEIYELVFVFPPEHVHDEDVSRDLEL